jgi:hypothetical protein
MKLNPLLRRPPNCFHEEKKVSENKRKKEKKERISHIKQ